MPTTHSDDTKPIAAESPTHALLGSLTKTITDKAILVLTMSGYIFLVVSSLALGAIVYLVTFPARTTGTQAPAGAGLEGLLQFGPHIVLLLVALFGATIGYSLLRAAGTANKEVIPQKDATLLYDLLRQDKTTGLDNYVKLASLSGFVGGCFKLGITGLPLATIGLTIFFALIGLVPGESTKGFFDLSKLTLGAFIGSFVQRSRLTFSEQPPSEPKQIPSSPPPKSTPGNVL